MGNPQHLEWLLEGVEAWNARREESDFRPDFSDMDARSAFVDAGIITSDERIPLGKANLLGADLRGANLRLADLGGANLRATDLGGADLRRADLGGGGPLEGGPREGGPLEGECADNRLLGGGHK